MNWLRTCAAVIVLVWLAAPAAAHPAPFSFVDVRLGSDVVELRLVLHVFDVAHELDIESPAQVLDPVVLAPHQQRLVELIQERLRVLVDGVPLVLSHDAWSEAEPLPERQSLQFVARATEVGELGVVTVDARMFPYDVNHQTFVNVYEREELTSQTILDDTRTEYEYFLGSRQGRLAVVQKFVPAGIHHILIGPDHLLFLIGLMLLGGRIKHLVLVVTGFTLAHSVTLTLAVMGILAPPARIVEAAIALSIIYVGVDNLMSRGGRDVRVWIAVVFGFIHGFGFASVLREMGLPTEALGWSLFSFNLGVEIGQLAVVLVVASALLALWSRSQVIALRVAYTGSVVVIAAGAFWFVERVFWSGGWDDPTSPRGEVSAHPPHPQRTLVCPSRRRQRAGRRSE